MHPGALLRNHTVARVQPLVIGLFELSRIYLARNQKSVKLTTFCVLISIVELTAVDLSLIEIDNNLFFVIRADDENEVRRDDKNVVRLENERIDEE